MTETYLDMMIKSLNDKIDVLTKITDENTRQKEILSVPGEADVDSFRKSVDEKAELIEKINKLNEGFDSLYEHVKNDLQDNKDKYKSEIATMQELIRNITELSTTIKAEEIRNKALAEKYFRDKRNEIRTNQKGNEVAYSYYETMSKSKIIMPQFIDKKN